MLLIGMQDSLLGKASKAVFNGTRFKPQSSGYLNNSERLLAFFEVQKQLKLPDRLYMLPDKSLRLQSNLSRNTPSNVI